MRTRPSRSYGAARAGGRSRGRSAVTVPSCDVTISRCPAIAGVDALAAHRLATRGSSQSARRARLFGRRTCSRTAARRSSSADTPCSCPSPAPREAWSGLPSCEARRERERCGSPPNSSSSGGRPPAPGASASRLRTRRPDRGHAREVGLDPARGGRRGHDHDPDDREPAGNQREAACGCEENTFRHRRGPGADSKCASGPRPD